MPEREGGSDERDVEVDHCSAVAVAGWAARGCAMDGRSEAH